MLRLPLLGSCQSFHTIHCTLHNVREILYEIRPFTKEGVVKKLVYILAAVLLAIPGMAEEEEPKEKVAIILLAGNETNEGMARALHALLYARELADSGCQVALIFDGAGTGWATEMSRAESPVNKQYLKFKEQGIVEEICDYCAEQFGHKNALTEAQHLLLVGDYEGHPDIAKWIKMGYRIIVI